jgi:hypothetical protein
MEGAVREEKGFMEKCMKLSKKIITRNARLEIRK